MGRRVATDFIMEPEAAGSIPAASTKVRPVTIVVAGLYAIGQIVETGVSRFPP